MGKQSTSSQCLFLNSMMVFCRQKQDDTVSPRSDSYFRPYWHWDTNSAKPSEVLHSGVALCLCWHEAALLPKDTNPHTLHTPDAIHTQASPSSSTPQQGALEIPMSSPQHKQRQVQEATQDSVQPGSKWLHRWRPHNLSGWAACVWPLSQESTSLVFRRNCTTLK